MRTQLVDKRESLYLPGVRLDDGIAVVRDLGEAARADALLLVVPAQYVRAGRVGAQAAARATARP